MPYDKAFYAQYQQYLDEPRVRKAHDWIFDIAFLNRDLSLSVVDFGCGQHQEWLMHSRRAFPQHYMGIDQSPDVTGLNIQADYRTMDLTTLPDHLTGFVSLFSSEITAPWYDNYRFYNDVFDKCPNIKAGLVSGFFYNGRRGEQPIREAGDVVSWQTLERPCEKRCVGYTEKRITLRVPSQMFGPNVYEVWKLFERWN